MNSVPDILGILPQRYPFLMIDKVIKINDKKIVALKNVSNNEPYFQGHFPGNPIMPGVLILEAMIQTGNLLPAEVSTDSREDYVGYVTAIDKVKFKKPVVPGDHLYLTVSILNKINTTWRFTGKADVNGTVVAEATWMGMLVNDLNNKE
jgi:beta-hydroxyacyl-ACP dehydratase FabZ